jgi:hypothetical protein
MKDPLKCLTVFITALILGPALSAQDQAFAFWNFEDVEGGKVRDVSGGIDDAVTGHFRVVPGVKGQAMVMDGYTTCIVRGATQVPKLGPDFSLDAWVALGAYPWNWTPIAAQENTVSLNSNLDAAAWPDDITVNSPRAGFYFGIGPQGHLGLHVGAGGWVVCQSENPVPLRKWTHVAAVFRGGEGISLYINARKAGKTAVRANFRQATSEDLRIGMSRQKIEPSHPVRAFATLPCWYALDGIIDELQVRRTALCAETVAGIFEANKPAVGPALPPRVLPSGPGVFGASYMNLQYYPEWDALWPVSSDPDIVVQFDDTPVRVVFWRGTRYSPAWVMDKDIWMADQSCENFSNIDGCVEHMLDPRCRFSHVRIIENSDARVVVHWRYCPTSANGNHSQVDQVTGWEDWVDEYYTFYPDRIGIRKVMLHTEGRSLGPEEVIALCHPGQRPEDIIDLAAMTLVNLKGQSQTYTWAETTPIINEGDKYLHFGSKPEEQPVILRVNLKSENKPFQIFETGNRVRIFAHEHRPGVSHFPWWNHWPVAQIPSDGRYCQAPDRASHFSLAWGGPPAHKVEGFYLWAWMYGATKQPAESLVAIARAWLKAPKLTSQGFSSRYDLTQRCYVVVPEEGGQTRALKLRLEGGPESPVCNPAIIVESWGRQGASLKLDGRVIPRGKDFRFGLIRRVNQHDLVVWIKLDSSAGDNRTDAARPGVTKRSLSGQVSPTDTGSAISPLKG